jgi:hypothetical protein
MVFHEKEMFEIIKDGILWEQIERLGIVRMGFCRRD